MHEKRLELFGDRTGNCFRAAIALEEAGLDYVARRIDLRSGAHYNEPFLALNPLGKVPVLIDHEAAEPLVLSQSNAIITYAAALSPGALTPDRNPAALARCNERFFFFVTDVIAPSHAAFVLQASGLSSAVAILDERVVSMARAAEGFLSEDAWMSGSSFGIADIVAFTILRSLADRLEWSVLPRLADWMERVEVRPGVRRGLAAFDEPPALG